MKKKIYIVTIFCTVLMLVFGQRSFAKYVMQDSLNMQLYIDKTPPQIDLICDGQTETFTSSNLTDAHKRSNDVKIDTSDNIKIKRNEYYFNSTSPNFEGSTSTEFASGQVVTEEGYYKIVATDTSGNQTEIIVLLDKSAPEVIVQYFKKGEANALINVKQISAISRYWATSEIVNATGEEVEESLEKENVVQEIEGPQENVENTVVNEDVKQENILKNQVNTSENQANTTENSVMENTVENQVATAEKKEEANQTEADEVQAKENISKEPEESVEKLQESAEETIQIVAESAEEDIEKNSAESAEELEINIPQDNQTMLTAIAEAYVGSEAEFRNALSSQAAVIRVRQSIDFTAPVYINYPVTVVAEGTSNALRYGTMGNFIVVENGGSLCLDSMVIDANSSGMYNITIINIQSGGSATFVNSSIIDGGLGNIGVLVNEGATLMLYSSEFVRCGNAINLQSTGQLIFGTQEGRNNNFYLGTTGVFIDNFTGDCNFNQNISMHDNSEYGIYIANSCGKINISSGTYYNNTYGISTRNITGGKVTVSGGEYYGNGWAIWAGGNLTLSGGSIHNNYHGVVTEPAYSGKFTMTGGNIYSNTSYAINHIKSNDGGCTILGGTITGDVYLYQNNNYINTNSSYPALTVTPSTYYFKRKLVKTDSNSIAQNEISNVTLTPKDSWYKYVDNEYIVLWQGCNVIVEHKDYYGKILSSEIITGNLGAQYATTAKAISGYDLILAPSNATGVFTQQDITVVYKYDLVNCAKVSFEDLLSGVVSAQYWYNASEENFSGNGTDFANNTVFENYGYYKIVVQNGVGLNKEITFLLNKDSLKR